MGSTLLTVFDPKQVAKRTRSPEPAAEGAMTLVAPQAAHAEAGVLQCCFFTSHRNGVRKDDLRQKFAVSVFVLGSAGSLATLAWEGV